VKPFQPKIRSDTAETQKPKAKAKGKAKSVGRRTDPENSRATKQEQISPNKRRKTEK